MNLFITNLIEMYTLCDTERPHKRMLTKSKYIISYEVFFDWI